MHPDPKQKSWIPKSDELMMKVTTQALIHEVSLQNMESAKTVVPWFLKNMPAAYFNQIPETLRRQHLRAISAIRDLKQSDLLLKIESKEADGSTEITYISSATAKGLLHSQIKNLVVPADSRLTRVKVFSSLDNSLSLNVFSFVSSKVGANRVATMDNAAVVMEYIDELKEGKHSDGSVSYSDLFSEASMRDYLTRIEPSYVESSHPRRFLIQRELFEQVKSTDGVALHIENYIGSSLVSVSQPSAWVTIAASNVLPEVLLRSSSAIIKALNMDINRSHLDVVSSHENSTPEFPGYVTMLRLLVSFDQASAKSEIKSKLDLLERELKKAKWLDDEVVDMGLVRYPFLGLEKAEIIVAICSMLHGPLHKQNQQYFASIKTIISILDSSPHFIQQADTIAQLFLDKFRPDGTAIFTEEYARRDAELLSKISRLHHDAGRILLQKMLETVRLTLRTNFYNQDRYALSLRVNPTIMGVPESKPLPFGVFFSHGRHFNAFHCRFRDIARGGLRIVTPPSSDQYSLESSRQFDEAYGLSYAQQLKNKDIPEGGAKAVVLVNTPTIPADTRFFAARKSVKAFTDSLLDLIVHDSVSKLVDYYKKDELIYLGPDEQVIPSDIDWVCNRAAQRGYPIPAAFMSSKKGAGINHKEFGVTSEGVVVYLDVALKNMLNIDPKKDEFTIKITGGPDGDVAGNLIRILFRDYGENARVVGIADGFGVAEDPNGLDSGELLRLVRESLPITSFNRSKLSKDGVMFDVVTDEGLARRLSMCFRVKSDVFIPAGGRPNTINIDNWRQFLDADGKPSSPLIVEGANIFTTPEAREMLFKEGGVTIVKDSSANKCGVITSSNEVAASMLLSKDEFMSVKEELVADVLVNLRHLARLEAEALFKEYKNYPGALPHFSERISNAINLVTDAITDALADVQPHDSLFIELMPLIKENLPHKLADVAWDRVPSRFPVQYQRNAIASTLASKLVYQEGIHLIETQPVNRLAERAFQYYREDRKVNELLKELEECDMSKMTKENQEKIQKIVRKGGVRSVLGIF